MNELTLEDRTRIAAAMLKDGYASSDNPIDPEHEFRHGFKVEQDSLISSTGKGHAFSAIIGDGIDLLVHGVFHGDRTEATILGVTELSDFATIRACLDALDKN